MGRRRGSVERRWGTAGRRSWLVVLVLVMAVVLGSALPVGVSSADATDEAVLDPPPSAPAFDCITDSTVPAPSMPEVSVPTAPVDTAPPATAPPTTTPSDTTPSSSSTPPPPLISLPIADPPSVRPLPRWRIPATVTMVPPAAIASTPPASASSAPTIGAARPEPRSLTPATTSSSTLPTATATSASTTSVPESSERPSTPTTDAAPLATSSPREGPTATGNSSRTEVSGATAEIVERRAPGSLPGAEWSALMGATLAALLGGWYAFLRNRRPMATPLKSE